MNPKANRSVIFRFIGCGDAFGSGGRFNTCFHVQGERSNFLIDCGATTVVALKRLKVATNAIRTILVTHFHLDHFGGLPPFLLDAQLLSKRTEPLTIAGPNGLQRHFARAMEVAFPGSSQTRHRFELNLVELTEREPKSIDDMTVTPYAVNHGVSGGPYFAYRLEVDGRKIAYTGDTEWVDCLIDVGLNADLLVAEAYFREKKVPLHLDLASLEQHLGDISPKRLILTHMSDDMLSRIGELPYECAEDDMVITL